ncbi:trypsin-like serine protease [Massilia sp. PAMC28688]|uniref:trypsin-like serine protease n=1 Tax=Massilia sp. PAMC28688 TaxID=2861283 RepID=UPI001C6280F7|nr:trypsin-like serine protease [Massilia sp. PAMC28688]QYF96063.1 trypsin-like serine protease [Massilia sp. PAMC28688]
MLERKFSVKKLVGGTVAAVALMSTFASAQAGILTDQVMTPMVVSGAPPDSPGARVDPNTADSKFSGVVSIQILSGGSGYICSGALVGARSVISAGHCVDIEGNGVKLDLNAPGNAVNVVFNASTVVGDPGRAVIAASAVSIHQDYQGFGNCPTGVSGFCVNDDVAVITLSKDAPAAAKIYKVSTAPVTPGTRIMIAGYGTSGNGHDGHNVSPSYRIKRTGQNYMDTYAGDDENGWGGKPEIYYADFDGVDANGVLRDTFCEWEILCSPILPNHIEANIGGGDSGGPSFIEMYGEMVLVANNTFGNRAGYTSGAFGSYFGGMILGSYADYLVQATNGRIALVPEPTGIALFGLGALALFGARRRSIKK